MSAPRISLITVCYNAESSIAFTLQSAREQTYRNFEHLIVDGASKDRTLDVVKKFSDLPLVIHSEPDKGIYDAMNKAIALARGDILFFLNADDALLDGQVLARVAEAFDADPALEFLWGDVVNAFPDGQNLTLSYAYINPDTLIYGSLCHQGVFAHKRLFERFGNFDLKYRLCADFDWFLRVLRGGAKYRYLDLDVSIFTRGGAHEKSLARMYREKALIRRKYVSFLPWAWGETYQYLRRRRYDLTGWIRRTWPNLLPAPSRRRDLKY